MPRASAIEQSSIDEAQRNLDRVTVIAIGASRYSSLEQLPGVARDIELVKSIFVGDGTRSIYRASRFIPMLNPTAEKARGEILGYANSRSANGDILILYFSGHGCVVGTNDFGFCLSDTLPSKEGGILPLSVVGFVEVVKTLSAAHVHPIFIIDACFSATAASTFLPSISAAMQDNLHIHVANSYGLLCSSGADTPSIDTRDGGAFTKALHAIVTNGLAAHQQRHWPFITLRGIASPLQERLASEGCPLSKCYIGPDLPETPIARNVLFKPQSEYFAPYMRRIIEYLWNDGHPREATPNELSNLGKGAYGNHSKLRLPPWGLVEGGIGGQKRKLTARGRRFAQGAMRIPEKLTKDPITLSWVAAPGTKRILITDVD